MKLATLQDSPTHKLSIKLDDDTFKVIYLSAEKAKAINSNINSKDQFIVIEEESHPKFACRVVKLTQRDIDELQRKHKLACRLQNENKEIEDHEKKMIFENKKREEVKNWCLANKEKAKEYMVLAKERLIIENPFFLKLGKHRIGLVKCEARKMIYSKELIRLDLSAREHSQQLMQMK